MAALAVIASAAYFVYGQRFNRETSRFADSVLRERWAEAYTFMGQDEKRQLNMTQDEFSRFCAGMASVGWPREDHVQFEEMTPFVPNGSTTETWDLAGTRKFAVTLRRPDGASDIASSVTFRHDPYGEWHPDVLPLVLAISRGIPHPHYAKALLAGLTAIHRNELETYPMHQRTTLANLKKVVATGKGVYMVTPIQSFR